jgi:predicted DNA-binding mobile mystery protein A
MASLDDLRLSQLDEALTPFRGLHRRPPPRQGWIRTIREGLGMSLRQMAERAGLSKTAARSAEANEAKGTIQLKSLRTLADALDCDLVYALVPKTSLRRLVEERATHVADRMVERVSDSMELEEQGVAPKERRRQRDDMAARILRDRGRAYWDD